MSQMDKVDGDGEKTDRERREQQEEAGQSEWKTQGRIKVPWRSRPKMEPRKRCNRGGGGRAGGGTEVSPMGGERRGERLRGGEKVREKHLRKFLSPDKLIEKEMQKL